MQRPHAKVQMTEPRVETEVVVTAHCSELQLKHIFWVLQCAVVSDCSSANISAHVVSSGSVHGQTCAQPHLGKTWNCYFSKSQRLSQQSTPFQLHCNWNIAGSQFQENPLSKISLLTTFQGLWPVQSTSKKYPQIHIFRVKHWQPSAANQQSCGTHCNAGFT